MKICWDNLENLRLVKSGKYFKVEGKKTKYYHYESCIVCGEPFLASGNNPKTCSIDCRGKKNSIEMTGIPKSEESKKRISNTKKGKPSTFKGKKHSEKSKKEMSKSKKGMYDGENNPRYGDHRTWEELYGKEKSDKLKQNLKKCHSGENNPNFGENHWVHRKSDSEIESWKIKIGKNNWHSPLIKGKNFEEIYGEDKSNNIKLKISNSVIKYNINNLRSVATNYTFGYSGYYKEHFFRSLNELSYIIYLMDNSIKFESAECKKYRINYKNPQGKWRYYFPDFYLFDTDELIEIKSTYTWNNKLELNKCKKYYAKIIYPKYKVLTEAEFKEENIHLINKSELIYKYNNDKNLLLTKVSKKRLNII